MDKNAKNKFFKDNIYVDLKNGKSVINNGDGVMIWSITVKKSEKASYTTYLAVESKYIEASTKHTIRIKSYFMNSQKSVTKTSAWINEMRIDFEILHKKNTDLNVTIRTTDNLVSNAKHSQTVCRVVKISLKKILFWMSRLFRYKMPEFCSIPLMKDKDKTDTPPPETVDKPVPVKQDKIPPIVSKLTTVVKSNSDSSSFSEEDIPKNDPIPETPKKSVIVFLKFTCKNIMKGYDKEYYPKEIKNMLDQIYVITNDISSDCLEYVNTDEGPDTFIDGEKEIKEYIKTFEG